MKFTTLVLLLAGAAALRGEPLSGTYTIKRDGSGDFYTFIAAGSAMVTRGIGGDVVFEADSGTYNDGIVDMRGANTAGHKVTFRPAPGHSVEIGSAGGAAVFLADGNLGATHNVKIEHLTFIDCSTGGWPTYAVNRLNGWRVSECEFSTPRGPWFNGSYDTVVGNQMRLTGTLGIYLMSAANCFVANNFVTGTTSNCIYFNTASGNLIYNNTLVADSASTSAMAMYQNSSSNTFYNNIVVSSWVCLYTGSMPAYSDNNCWYRHDGNAALFYLSNVGQLTLSAWRSRSANRLDMHSIGVDPLLVDETADLHLQSSSPCIDTGMTLASVTTDIDGQPRTTPYDIGADEYVPTGLEGDAGCQIADFQLQIEPNPAGRGLVTARVRGIKEPVGQAAKVEVFDAAGRCVATHEITVLTSEFAIPLDTRTWSSGVYLVRIEGACQSAARLVLAR